MLLKWLRTNSHKSNCKTSNGNHGKFHENQLDDDKP